MRLRWNLELLAAFTQQKLIQLRKHLSLLYSVIALYGTSFLELANAQDCESPIPNPALGGVWLCRAIHPRRLGSGECKVRARGHGPRGRGRGRL